VKPIRVLPRLATDAAQDLAAVVATSEGVGNLAAKLSELIVTVASDREAQAHRLPDPQPGTPLVVNAIRGLLCTDGLADLRRSADGAESHPTIIQSSFSRRRASTCTPRRLGPQPHDVDCAGARDAA